MGCGGWGGVEDTPAATLQSRLCSELPGPLALDPPSASLLLHHSLPSAVPAGILDEEKRKEAFRSWLPSAGVLPLTMKAAGREEEVTHSAGDGVRLLSVPECRRGPVGAWGGCLLGLRANGSPGLSVQDGGRSAWRGCT